MAPSRAFGFSSSSASSRHANKARPTSDDEDHSEADDSYRRMKKSTTTTMSSSAAGKSSSAAHRSKRPHETAAADYDSRSVKKSTSTSSSRRPRTQHDDSGAEEDGDVPGLSDELLMERRAYDEWIDKKLSKLSSKREQLLEERLERIRSERDEIQSQYDELRQLRDTAPEQALEEFKKTAEARYRHDKDLINSLKAKIEAAEKRAKEAEGGAAADRSMSILNASIRESVQPAFDDAKLEELKDAHRREMLEAERKQRRLEEDVRSYKLQLEQEIAQSKSLRSKSSANAEPSSAASTSLAAFEDEKAVRKLYEDLTGLVVTGVEKIDANEPFRRFKAIFAQEDYYSVLMDLEESSSKLSSGKNGTRADIVYVPKIDDDRDGELLNSQMVPQEWLDALRFDRNMLFKWYEKTRKALMTDKARLKLRAREERAGRH